MSLAADRRGGAAGRVGASTAAPVVTGAPRYVGLVTRTLAFAVDAAAINAVALLASAVLTLAVSIVAVPPEVRTIAAAIGGALYALWIVGYFVTFWSTTGQTPGSRLLGIRVRPADGGHLPSRRALLRFVALILAAIPLFAGLLVILVDDRRRGWHDRIARTVVVDDER